jgi:UDP-3-O-[3-hydroxymyristoyl] N-acetylglucosamine deacetylase/UDP-3-O-[3-hydroxymyristoyl] N-acetylglucosamine deacetylase/3-hydroxyacyl-[acyl-carrier-protein] dehydratase
VRHKILDCLGDFALIGCDLYGHFSAYRSGHRLNREIIRRVQMSHQQGGQNEWRRAA